MLHQIHRKELVQPPLYSTKVITHHILLLLILMLALDVLLHV